MQGILQFPMRLSRTDSSLAVFKFILQILYSNQTVWHLTTFFAFFSLSSDFV